MKKKQLTIAFGALQPSIAQQLKKQGFKFDKGKVRHFEKLRESITYVVLNDLITENSRIQADKKLFNKIQQHVQDKNK